MESFRVWRLNHDWIEGGLDILSITRHLPLHNKSWHILLLCFVGSCGKKIKRNSREFQWQKVLQRPHRKMKSTKESTTEVLSQIGYFTFTWRPGNVKNLTNSWENSYSLWEECRKKFVCEKCEKSPIQPKRQGKVFPTLTS